MRTLILFIGALLSVQAGAVELQGQLIQGGLIHGKVAPGSRVELGEHSVKVAENGVFVAGFDRDAPAVMTLRVCHDGDCASQELAIAQREYAVQRVNGVPQKTVTPPAEVLARIRQESAMVGKARRRSEDRQDFLNTYQWPLIGPITGVFGSQRVYNGTPGRPHYGVDVARPVGATVTAPNSGVVTLVHNDMFYSGGTLIIDHGQGLNSAFLHSSRLYVSEGEQVRQGQHIGDIGASGRATGPHLHWSLKWRNSRLDPLLFTGPMR